MHTDPLKVIYISGIGRSGSTLLGRVLGHAPGFAPLGEGYGIWTRGVEQNEPCSCGARFRECPLWQDVYQQSFGGFDALHESGLIERGHPLVRKFDMLALLSPWRTAAQRS